MTDAVTFNAYNNAHFVLSYQSVLLIELIAQYPNAEWRAQIREAEDNPVVNYQWTSAGLLNEDFTGTITVDAINSRLLIVAPNSEVRTLAGTFVFGLRLEDAASNADIYVIDGVLNFLQGSVYTNEWSDWPVPIAVQTVTYNDPSAVEELVDFWAELLNERLRIGLPGGLATLDNAGLLTASQLPPITLDPMEQLPITRRQGMQALLASGTAYPSEDNWFTVVAESIPGDETDNVNQAWYDPFWPESGVMWDAVGVALADYFDWTLEQRSTNITALQVAAKEIDL